MQDLCSLNPDGTLVAQDQEELSFQEIIKFDYVPGYYSKENFDQKINPNNFG